MCRHLSALKDWFLWWVSVSSIGKISDGCIRNLEFNPRLYQKLIGVLVDNKKLLSGVDAIG